MAVSSSIGVAEVAASAIATHDRSRARPSGVSRCSRMRRQIPGRQCTRFAWWRSIASQMSTGSVVAKTIASRACHCCIAIVHAPMWKSGNGATIAPFGSSSAPGCVRSTFTRLEITAPFGRPVLPLVKNTTCVSRLTQPRLVHVGVVLAHAEPRQLDERDADPRRDRGTVGGSLGVGGDRRRLRRRDHHLRFLGREQRADRCEHRAELRQRHEQREHVEGGVVPRHDPVGVTHAECGERARHLVAAPVELGERDRLVDRAMRRRGPVPPAPRCGRCRRSAGRQPWKRASVGRAPTSPAA